MAKCIGRGPGARHQPSRRGRRMKYEDDDGTSRNKRWEREIEFLKHKTCGEHIYNQPLPKKSQKQGDHMRKHYFLSSLVIFVAGFALSAIVDGRRLASIAQGAPGNLTKLEAYSAAPEVAAQTTRQPSTIQNWEYHVVNTMRRRNDQGGSAILGLENQRS